MIRRLASLGAIVVAALASLATSPAPVTPPPSIEKTVSGSSTLTHDHPVEVRRVTVRISWPDRLPQGRAPSVVLTPRLRLPLGVDLDLVRASVIRAVPDAENPDGSDVFREVGASVPSERSLELDCVERKCEGAFALVIEPAAGMVKGDVSVDWELRSRVELWAGEAAGGADVTVAVDDRPLPAVAIAADSTAGEAVRLDAEEQIAMWRIRMTLGSGPLADPPGWPVVVRALLSSSTQVLRPADGAAMPNPDLFVEDSASPDVATTADGANRIEFQPFWACDAATPCEAEYIVGLAWAHTRPEVAFESSWRLELRAIATDGSQVPVSVAAERVPRMPMATGTLSGTYVVSRDDSSGAVRYAVAEVGGTGRDRQWDGLRLPVTGILRATMRDSGVDPLPANLHITFGTEDLGLTMRPGEKVAGVFGTPPRCRVGDCELAGELTSGLGWSGALPETDWEATIDWSLELSAGTTATGGHPVLVMTRLTGS